MSIKFDYLQKEIFEITTIVVNDTDFKIDEKNQNQYIVSCQKQQLKFVLNTENQPQIGAIVNFDNGRLYLRENDKWVIYHDIAHQVTFHI